jgi:hypothetical protein
LKKKRKRRKRRKKTTTSWTMTLKAMRIAEMTFLGCDHDLGDEGFGFDYDCDFEISLFDSVSDSYSDCVSLRKSCWMMTMTKMRRKKMKTRRMKRSATLSEHETNGLWPVLRVDLELL